MRLLTEYAITPDVFEAVLYPHEEVANVRLRELKHRLLEEAVVRDLRSGEWLTSMLRNQVAMHSYAKELLSKMKKQGRLIKASPIVEAQPTSAVEWCREAMGSHGASPLRGIFTQQATAECFVGHEHYNVLGAMNLLERCDWWTERGCSVRLPRTIDKYLDHLGLILESSNSLMFIDPHLDPERAHYRNFPKLLERTTERGKKPLIEIHRVCYLGSGQQRKIWKEEWERPFREWLGELAGRLGLTIEVFIWDDFHDRYLISNLVGILMPNGFDTSVSSTDMTTWSRMDRAARDDVQREFTRETHPNRLHHRFII
ncbi:MAG: hypothetical protein KF868_08920 [Acidobacteria bacterium]|nr:hypothetical protein [Acidobacteriota bacterium]MCW5971167.1 hypothetical protein [Blastocatellales bacterium]